MSNFSGFPDVSQRYPSVLKGVKGLGSSGRKKKSTMTSKVLVKLPTVPFAQGKKPTPDLVTLPTRNDPNSTPPRSQQAINGDRIAQLEQNMKFLQEQHQATLIALHQEVETLRQRNRDLQFQLVFTKGTACSSPSSPEDNSNGFVKSKGSPISVNVTPLEIELLEHDLEKLKTSFNEVKKQNSQLQKVIDEQKIKLEEEEKQKEKLKVTDVAVQVCDNTSETIQNDLTSRLEDAEAIVKRLQRENADQAKEIATIKASAASTSQSTSGKNSNRNGSSRGRGNDNGQHSRGASDDLGQSNRNSYKFPPLEGESYWRNVTRGRTSYDNYRRNRLDKETSEADMPCRFVLPELPDIPCYPQFYRAQRGYHNGGNYYRDSGNRKFRGQGRQKDRRDQQDHNNDYKDRNSKDQYHDGAYTSKKQ